MDLFFNHCSTALIISLIFVIHSPCTSNLCYLCLYIVVLLQTDYVRFRVRWRPPKFAHQLWHCSGGACNDMPNTKNAVEGWHTVFQATLDIVYSHIHKLSQAIKRDQSLIEGGGGYQRRGKKPFERTRIQMIPEVLLMMANGRTLLVFS